ncbi:MAG TPA: hypothetical protein VH278_17025 [Burkholderiaceae bacterium]|nr:hypothetical protein [Burkholderiaceae bacterium]
MTQVLLVGGALIFEPEWNQLPAGFVPDRLDRLMRRAPRAWHTLREPWSDGAAHLEWLARTFSVPGDPPACAAYSWRAVSGEGGSQAYESDVWFCDPVHLSLEPERTVLSAIDAPALAEAENRELFNEAADAAKEHAAVLREAAGRWYLFPREPWALRTMPLQAALGASIEARLPQGAHASHWRRLLNEVQMRWHASRVNRERDSRGQQVANGLWLHGGGPWRKLEPSRFGQVHSGDPVVLGWWQAADAAKATTRSDSLTVWPHLFGPYWRRDWSAWAAAWAQLDLAIASLRSASGAGPRRSLELVTCGRQGVATFTLGAGTSLLPWRRRALRECLLESVTS